MTEVAADVRDAVRAFAFSGEVEGFERYGSGHINDTFAVGLRDGGGARRVILQRINTSVFRDPESLMANVGRVTRHLAKKLFGAPDASRRSLSLIPTRGGADFHRDGAGGFWRAYGFIEGARSRDVLTAPRQAVEAARAFGTFQRLLTDLPGPRLAETIPRFHDTPWRLARFREVLARDPFNRAAEARRDIDAVLSREALAQSLTPLLSSGVLGERVTHNDTKLNNVLLDEGTGEGLCVIDLDTVMPGLWLHDFGDMVRTGTNPVSEDDRDLSKVVASRPMFEALARGYLSATGEALAPEERDRLVLSGKLLTYECGMRFLTDHLEGDVYFRIHRPGQNLDRARTQLALLASLEEQEDALTRLVERLSR